MTLESAKMTPMPERSTHFFLGSVSFKLESKERGWQSRLELHLKRIKKAKNVSS